jgi:MurNAc alpha-1-phosphate uridylyltransferase
MKAMIFAAGLGTRLQPLTDSKPKALIEIGGITLLEITIQKLIKFGYNDIIINIHHHATKIIRFLEEKQCFGARINISDESDQLLDTGGGLKKAAHFLESYSPVILHNVDILSDVNLDDLANVHKQNGKDVLATLVVNNRDANRVFLVNKDDRLCGWKNFRTQETKIPVSSEILEPVSFCGIQIVDPKLLSLIKMEGVFSMVDIYLQLCKDYKIQCWRNNQAKWLDVGTIENLKQAEKMFF